MLHENSTLKIIALLAICLFLHGCKTIPQSGGGSSSGSSSSSGTSSGSSSSGSGSTASLPSGGYNPFPSSRSQSSKGSKQSGKEKGNDKSKGKEKGKTGADQASSKSKGAEKVGGGQPTSARSEDELLADALEEFERARKGENGQGEQAGAGGETDFPVLVDSSDEDGDALEKVEGVVKDDSDDKAVDPQAAQTSHEKIAVLDRRLEEGYGQFEGVILREKDYVRGKENARGSNADIDVGVDEDSAGSPNSDGQSSGEGDAEQRGPITGSGAGSRPPGGDQREGDFEHAAVTYKPPPDIPDGSDDDVVARQLREAAMQEPDQELREKLWVEYRKYKNKVKSE